MPENRAFLRLVVNAGSLHEEDHEQGLAHFVEHMAFRGTERFPEADLVNYLRSLGMRMGPDINAFTSFDRTVYRIEVPVETDNGGTRIIPDTALAIIDDWSRAITFAPEAVEAERPVIVEEYRGRLGAAERIRREWLPVLFRGSRFASRMPIGQLDIIENATADDLEGYYRRWYQADNMALILVGDFDGAALEASLTNHFMIDVPDAPTIQTPFDLPPTRRGNMETLVLTDPELTSTNVMLYFRRSRQPVHSDLAFFRESVIDYLIQNMMGFRFVDALTNPETPFIDAWTNDERWGASSRFYTLSAVAKSGLAEETLVELLRANEMARRHGFTDAEIALAGETLVSYYQRLVQERDRQDSGTFVDLLTRHSLEGQSMPDFEWELDAIQRLLPGISARDVNAMVRDYFASNDIQAFVFAPESERETLPDDSRIRHLVSQRGRMNVQRPVQRALEDSLVSVSPEPGKIVANSIDAETGAVIWQLENGAKVILQSTENRNDEIVLQAMARGGTTSVSDEDSVSAILAAEMIQVSGLGPWSLPDLSRQLAAKQASLSSFVTNYTRGFQGSSTSGDLRTLFEMLYLNFTDPRIDGDAVDAMMDRYRSALALRGENPRTVFSDEVNRTITGDQPRFRPLELDDLPRANIDSALAFLRRSLNPADFTFVFTGNLTPDLMAPLVETYLASIPRGETWNTWTDLNIVRPGKVENHVFRGLEEQSIVYMAWFVPATFTEQLSIVAQALNEYLNIRLNEEIRENLGGVYGIGAGVGVSPSPRGELSLQVQFTCDPQRVQELSDAVVNLLRETATGSIVQVTFNDAIEAMHQGLRVSMQSNSFIAQSYVNSAVLLELPLSRLQQRPQNFNAVTPAAIQGMIAQLLPNGPAKVVLFPENFK
jgi:zinc protease